MGARDVRSCVPLLMFDWKELTPPRWMLHVVVDGGLLYDDVCMHGYVRVLLVVRALRARATVILRCCC